MKHPFFKVISGALVLVGTLAIAELHAFAQTAAPQCVNLSGLYEGTMGTPEMGGDEDEADENESEVSVEAHQLEIRQTGCQKLVALSDGKDPQEMFFDGKGHETLIPMDGLTDENGEPVNLVLTVTSTIDKVAVSMKVTMSVAEQIAQEMTVKMSLAPKTRDLVVDVSAQGQTQQIVLKRIK